MTSRWITAAALAATLWACGGGQREVVVYTAHDQRLSEPILDLFEEETGIQALAVYDTEATKTTGLVNRLLAEADRPQCDVFWNNEIVQTLRLVREGVTQPHLSQNAAGIPAAFQDPEGHWTGFAARARVIVYNTALQPERPKIATYDDILRPPWARESGIALPLFGTTATHFALIHSQLGPEGTQRWLDSLTENGVQVLDSNGQVCDAVARGALRMGWTDTDDVAVAQAEGYPVAQVLPSSGMILIPNTVCMIDGAPHRAEARALIDFLLRADIEHLMASGPGRQIPLHAGVSPPRGVLRLQDETVLEVDWNAVADSFDAASELAARWAEAESLQ
ncbi:extracellular solute-binding protein [Candidatus Sumerlaeota bacterium]|nr:extracellular solute-binding protein [Candidatus Sumerlaeota bacterium]